MTITEFLEARIAEDETAATEAAAWVANGPEPRFEWFGAQGDIVIARFGTAGAHVAKWSPDRALAECAAKRWVLDTLRSYEPNDEWDTEPDMGKRGNNAAGAVRGMAAVYEDHPDYDPEWALS